MDFLPVNPLSDSFSRVRTERRDGVLKPQNYLDIHFRTFEQRKLSRNNDI